MLTIKEIKDAVTPICQEYGVKRLILFGSYARNEANEESDYQRLFHVVKYCRKLEAVRLAVRSEYNKFTALESKCMAILTKRNGDVDREIISELEKETNIYPQR